jgi:hypothetical protein
MNLEKCRREGMDAIDVAAGKEAALLVNGTGIAAREHTHGG